MFVASCTVSIESWMRTAFSVTSAGVVVRLAQAAALLVRAFARCAAGLRLRCRPGCDRLLLALMLMISALLSACSDAGRQSVSRPCSIVGAPSTVSAPEGAHSVGLAGASGDALASDSGEPSEQPQLAQDGGAGAMAAADAGQAMDATDAAEEPVPVDAGAAGQAGSSADPGVPVYQKCIGGTTECVYMEELGDGICPFQDLEVSRPKSCAPADGCVHADGWVCTLGECYARCRADAP